MKLTSKQLAYNITKNSEISKLNLIHGDDLGLIKDLSKKLTKTISNGDELAIEHISALKICEDQSVLFDSLFAISMFASLKVIIIDDIIDLGQKQRKFNDIIAGLLDEQDRLEDTFVIIPALSLEASSAVVKKFEKDSTAISVRCFVDNNMDLKKVILEFFTNKNKSIDTKALIYLQNSLGNDRMITLQELEKLDIYTLNSKEISLQDCLDCITSADSVNLFKFCDAVGMKDKNLAQKMLFLLEEEGHDITVIASGLIRHLKRLLIVKSNAEKDGTPASANINKLRPPVFFGKDEFIKQVDNFDIQTLEQAVFNFTTLQVEARLNPKMSKSQVEEFIFSL